MELDVLRVDAFLADSVVVAENKLYVQGGGWDSLWTNNFPVRHPRIGIGVVLTVPWSATNQMHTFEVSIVDPNGKPIVLGDAPPGLELPEGKVRELRGQFNVGRPPVLNLGDSQVVPIAMNLDGLMFSEPTTYSVIVSVDGSEMRRLPIRVRSMVQSPSPAQPPRTGA